MHLTSLKKFHLILFLNALKIKILKIQDILVLLPYTIESRQIKSCSYTYIQLV